MLPYTAFDAINTMRASHGLEEGRRASRYAKTDAGGPSPPIPPEPPDGPTDGLRHRLTGLLSLGPRRRPRPWAVSPRLAGTASSG